jgi:hypothetical protein
MTRAERVFVHPATGRSIFWAIAALLAFGLLWDDARAGEIAAALATVLLAAVLTIVGLAVGNRARTSQVMYTGFAAYALLQLGFAIAGERLPRSMPLALLAVFVGVGVWHVARRSQRRASE